MSSYTIFASTIQTTLHFDTKRDRERERGGMKEKQMKAAASSISKKQTYASPYLITLLLFILIVSILYSQNSRCLITDDVDTQPESLLMPEIKHEKLPFALRESNESCDVFNGKWVRDEVHRPLYEEYECPYIQPQLTCQAQGRPDKDYQFWRWQPNQCNLPR